MLKLSFIMLAKIYSDESDNDEERNPTSRAPECFCWSARASAMAFDSRGSTHKTKKKREQDEHSEINKNICVRDFEICYFSPHRWNNIFNLWANFTQKQNESFSRSKSEKNREIICRRGEKCFSNFSALFRR